MILSAIAAVSENQVIGNHNELPWKLPEDLKYFKNRTWGMPVIMGRKTFESVGTPRPGRKHIVTTSQATWKHPGVTVVHNLEEALAAAKKEETQEVFITGGSQVFQEAFPILNRIYLTRIYEAFVGDSYFPVLTNAEWNMVQQDRREADEKNQFSYSFQIWERIKDAR
ncbi:MAG: dihydrofolate reductase [Chitinophagaceae bacterium]